MSHSDDFYYKVKPHATLVRRQHLSLEACGAADRYTNNMHARDGTLPDERKPDGMRWHITALGVRDRRTVSRVIVELLESGELVRLGDGRLTSPEVQKELAARAKKRSTDGGTESGGGSAPPQARQFTLLPGGKPPAAAVDETVDAPVDTVGTLREMLRSRRGDARLKAISRLKTQRNQWAADSCRVRDTHEVVAVFDGNPARARGDPWSVRA